MGTKSDFASSMAFESRIRDDGSCVTKFEVTDGHLNRAGVLHGGLLAAVADQTAGLCASAACPKGSRVVTAELNISMLLPANDSHVHAEARLRKVGSRLIVAQCDIYGRTKPDERKTQRLVATARGTFAVI